jgi:hypothetical protein
MKNQERLMEYDPATCEQKPYPSHEEQWRQYHGRKTAWLYNPWTGCQRGAEDVGSDVTGLLILPPDSALSAYREQVNAVALECAQASRPDALRR